MTKKKEIDWREKFPIGSTWSTRGGDKAIVIDHQDDSDDEDDEHIDLKILVWHKDEADTIWHCDNGKDEDDESHDLIKPWKPIKKLSFKAWVNIDTDGTLSSYRTRKDADLLAHSDRIACHEIEIKSFEGEGLEDKDDQS